MLNINFKKCILIALSLSAAMALLFFLLQPKRESLISEWRDDSGPVKIAKYFDLNEIPLPSNLKEYLFTKEGSSLNVIYFDGNKLMAHDSFDGDYFSVLYLKAMKRLAESDEYKLFPGYYLISFMDGVHTGFDWPVLGFAGEKKLVENSAVILLPDPDAMQGYTKNFAGIDQKLSQYAWNQKIPKIFWRGSANGIKYDSVDINGAPRLRFLNAATNLKFADVGLTGYAFLINDEFRQKLMDTHAIKESLSPEESIRYKYLIDVDGKSCSWSRMAWILYSNSVLLKHQSDKVQWYYERLKPYVHYVPIAEDFSDLEKQFVWLEQHPKEAVAIALNGREIAKQIFTEEALLKAIEQSLLKYNAIVNDKLVTQTVTVN